MLQGLFYPSITPPCTSNKVQHTDDITTGGSGFIAAHVLDILLQHGHQVTTTVRSQAKADFLQKAHPDAKIDFKIVEDIAQEGAFDEAVKIEGLEAVIHTASPFHFVCRPRSFYLWNKEDGLLKREHVEYDANSRIEYNRH